MAEHDQETSPSGLMTADFMLHLWRRRWWIVALTMASFVMCYLAVRAFAGEIYETRALIYVRPQPPINLEDEQPGMPAPAFRSMFTADHTLAFIRDQYNERFENDPEFPDKITQPLEKYRLRFYAGASTLVDTTISTEYSPVIELRAKGTSTWQSRRLMELWIQRILNKYGNMLSEEAQFLADSSRRRAEELKGEVQETVAKKKDVEKQQEMVESKLTSAMRQLTFMPQPKLKDVIGNDIMGFNMRAGPERTGLTIEQIGEGTEPGLWERRTQLKVELAGMEADPSAAAGEIARLKAELVRIEQLIPEIEEEVTSLRDEAVSLAAESGGLSVELNRLEYAVRLNSTVASQAEAKLRAVSASGEEYSTLRLLDPPVSPQKRVAPKRTLIAGLSAAGVFALLLVIFCMELYLRNAIALQAKREGLT
ncbi:hypothetical protein KQI84_17370 [bacterium]|nr:hypothetical protein [bacterium]